MPALADFPVVVECPVQWGEMDAYQHVNNVVYLRWFETGRAAYFDLAGLWDRSAPSGVAPIFHSVSCRYRVPLTYPDRISIGVRVKEVSGDRFVIEHVVFSERHGRVAAEGDGVIVAFDYDKGGKASVPDAWRRSFERIEGRTFEAD